MVEIKFNAKIRDLGTVAVITVPIQYIKDGLLWTGTEFGITVDTKEPAGDI